MECGSPEYRRAYTREYRKRPYVKEKRKEEARKRKEKQKICPTTFAVCHPNRPHLAKGFCKSCYQKQRYHSDPIYRQKHLDNRKQYRDKNRDKILANYKENSFFYIKRKGHLGPGKCQICSRDVKSLNRDHCHWTGFRRGELCRSCNLMIGNAKNHPLILRKAADYLERFYGSLEGDSRRLVDARLDEVLASSRVPEEFPVLLGDLDDRSMSRKKSMGRPGYTQDIRVNECFIDSTQRSRKDNGTTGCSNKESDSTSSDWTSQADGVGWEAN